MLEDLLVIDQALLAKSIAVFNTKAADMLSVPSYNMNNNGGMDNAFRMIRRSASLFGGLEYAIRNSLTAVLSSKNVLIDDSFLMLYSLHISALYCKDNLDGRNNKTDTINQKKNEKIYSKALIADGIIKKEIILEGGTSYDNIRNLVKSLSDYIAQKKNPSTKDFEYFFNAYSNITYSSLFENYGNNVESVRNITWKIGDFGIQSLNLQQNAQKAANSTDALEKDMFYTQLKCLDIAKHRILPKERIIGDRGIIDFLEKCIDSLFLYNPKNNMNPLLEEDEFISAILLEGMPGEGKGEVINHILNYARSIDKRIKLGLKVTELEIESSYLDGNIQKLKSQLSQINDSNNIHILLQDEITRLFISREGKSKDTKEDVIMELQTFLQGTYNNRGNYLFLATTNIFTSIPLALRNRFMQKTWAGARTQEEKAMLFRYKLEKGIIDGYVSISDDEFYSLGKLAEANQLNGRDITNVCIRARRDSFNHGMLGKIWQSRDNYEEQRKLIRKAHRIIGYSCIEAGIIELVKDRIFAEANSEIYKKS